MKNFSKKISFGLLLFFFLLGNMATGKVAHQHPDSSVSLNTIPSPTFITQQYPQNFFENFLSIFNEMEESEESEESEEKVDTNETITSVLFQIHFAKNELTKENLLPSALNLFSSTAKSKFYLLYHSLKIYC